MDRPPAWSATLNLSLAPPPDRNDPRFGRNDPGTGRQKGRQPPRSDIYIDLRYLGPVRRLLPFLACLMLMLTTMSGMAHAADVTGGSIAGVELSMHTDGDSDEVPADSDKGYPHHHTVCHGHDIGKPMQPDGAWAHIAPGMQAVASLVAILSGTTGTVDLRPPQA